MSETLEQVRDRLAGTIAVRAINSLHTGSVAITVGQIFIVAKAALTEMARAALAEPDEGMVAAGMLAHNKGTVAAWNAMAAKRLEGLE